MELNVQVRMKGKNNYNVHIHKTPLLTFSSPVTNPLNENTHIFQTELQGTETVVFAIHFYRIWGRFLTHFLTLLLPPLEA